MNKIKKSCLFRIISLVLILTFISLDISYAYPPEHNVSNSTLATPSVLQQTPINDHAARFQQSVFSQSALIASVYDIGEYFFGNVDKGIEPLPSKYAEDAMRADLEKHLTDASTEILNIVPVEYIKKTAPDKLKAALDEIGFKGTLPDEGVVFILYKKGEKKFLVQVARKDQVFPDSLPGYEWVISDKYVVKYMPEDHKEEVAQPAALPETIFIETKNTAPQTPASNKTAVELPVKIYFIGVGSPAHYDMWNNLSLETLAGDLKGEFGDSVNIDMLWTNNPEEVDSIVKKAMANTPGIIGLSIQPGSMEIVKLLAAKLNTEQAVKEGRAMVVFGNQLPTYIPEEFIKMCPQGIVIRGEGEIAMRSLVRVAKGELELFDVPNAVYKNRSGDIVHTRIISPKLDSMKYSPTTNTYVKIDKRGGNVQVQASRGCPWGGCAYCTRTSFRRGGRVTEKGGTASWEGFTVERVLKTLDDVMSRGITEVEFSDDEFIGGRKDENINRIIAIAEGIKKLSGKHGIKFSFRIFTRPDIIYRESNSDNKNEAIRQLMLRLKDAGLVRVFIGIEAGNESQLKRYTRGIKLSEVTEVIKILKEMELGIDAGFIMFDPELTIDEMLENVRYFRENNLIENNQWSFRPMSVNLGSRIVRRLQNKGLLGEENANFMEYKYNFKNSSIEKIARIVDDISKKTRTIFYALKVKSKIFDPVKKDKKIFLCQKYIEDNGLIYLDLMEEIGNAIQGGATQEEVDAIARRADERAIKLAKDVSTDVACGRINDEDGYLKKELAKIGIKDNASEQSFYPPSDVIQCKPDTAHKATQLFEIVGSSLNNERAKFIELGNKIISSPTTKTISGNIINISTVDKKMATAEIRQRVERAISVIEGLEKENISAETKATIELLKKNLNQFEADGAVGALIVLARRAQRESQKLIIGLETNWIPGVNVKRSLQRNAIAALMKEMDGLGEALKSMGLDNVEVIRGSGSQLAGAILNEAEKTHTRMHNIVVMASANTINSNSFAVLKNADENDRPFLTGIDPTELIKLYTQFGEAVSKQLYIRLASLLYMTLELAAGKEPPQSPIIVSYDKKLRILILLPKADPIDYETLKNNYAAEKAALQAA